MRGSGDHENNVHDEEKGKEPVIALAAALKAQLAVSAARHAALRRRRVLQPGARGRLGHAVLRRVRALLRLRVVLRLPVRLLPVHRLLPVRLLSVGLLSVGLLALILRARAGVRGARDRDSMRRRADAATRAHWARIAAPPRRLHRSLSRALARALARFVAGRLSRGRAHSPPSLRERSRVSGEMKIREIARRRSAQIQVAGR
jgi:hypothetical protein